MNTRLFPTIFNIVFAVALCAIALPASAGLDIEEGKWRLELNTDFGVHQGSRDRSGDFGFNAVVEYEVPATSRTTLGLRLMPLFLYTQDDTREHDFLSRVFDEQRHEDGGSVYGAGLGLAGRIYQIKDEYRGWYGELAFTTLVHEDTFNGNSSNLNFMTGLGVGYQFKSDWHVQFHYQHISNASLGNRNSGTNTLGLGIGYRF